MRQKGTESSPIGDSHALPYDSGETQFRSLLEMLPAGAYTCDATGLITYFNQHAVQLWGRAPKLNDPVDRFCGSFKLYTPAGKPVAHEDSWMALALKNGQPYLGQEIVIERPDGSRITVLAHANPLRSASGEIVGAVNVLIDVSDRLRADEAQSRLAAIVESSTDAIISKTLDGKITFWNAGAQSLFGYTAEEMVGASITRLIPPERQEEERQILERISRGERIEHFETVRIAKDGRRIDILLNISPIRDSAGRIVGASKVARDIAAQKRAAEAFREADRRKDEFLATLAHELRNPLAPICNSLHLLRMSDDLTPAVKHVREILERQVNHMIRLIDDLLETARITQGKLELRTEHIELSEAIGSAVEISRPLVEAAGHQLAVTLCAEPLTVEADPVRLTQVIINLLNNAAKYTPNGGQIWLTARYENGEAAISVRDNGRGIAPEMLPRVFDMFAQADRKSSGARSGLGIGLALASRLIEMHGGRIEATSSGIGQGSEFVVRLPLSTEAAQVNLPAKVVRGPSSILLSTRRILVVDDSPSSAYLLGKLLEALNQQVISTENANAALRLACDFQPHIIISDISMPQMDGYELARRLRSQPGLEDAILIALTGYGQERDRERARAAGFDHFLVKPVSVESLQELLMSLPTPSEPAAAPSAHQT